MSANDSRLLYLYLEKHHLTFYATTLINNGFTLKRFQEITMDDVKRLRITNPKERLAILKAAQVCKDEIEADKEKAATEALKRLSAADRQRELIIQQELETAQEGRDNNAVSQAFSHEFPEYTATMPTANECARQATVYLAHQSVERPWPKSGSKLSQSLHLSSAAPITHDPMYAIKNEGGSSSTVMPPFKHEHGFSAKFCNMCQEHVSESMQGAWQYQNLQRALIGDGQFEEVLVWKPFQQTESLKIEYGYKRRQDSLRIRGKMVNFEKMLWWGKRMRRVDAEYVPFPSLKKRDVVKAPQRKYTANDAQMGSMQYDMELQIFELNKNLCDTEEKRSRLAIQQLQDIELCDILAEIEAIMLNYFARQRKDLGRQEEEERERIEGPEYERDLDRIYDFIEKSVRNVAVQQARKDAERILQMQIDMLSKIEAIAREDIIAEEEAQHKNLRKLFRLLNDQWSAMCEVKRKRAKFKEREMESGVRCPVCRLTKCVFFKNKWHGHWRERGGALDPKLVPDKLENLAGLVGKAGEEEYHEYVKNNKAEKEHKQMKARIYENLGLKRIGANDGDSNAAASGIPQLRPQDESQYWGSPAQQEKYARRVDADPRAQTPDATASHYMMDSAEGGLPPRPTSAAPMTASGSQQKQRPSSAGSGRTQHPKPFCSSVPYNSTRLESPMPPRRRTPSPASTRAASGFSFTSTNDTIPAATTAADGGDSGEDMQTKKKDTHGPSAHVQRMRAATAAAAAASELSQLAKSAKSKKASKLREKVSQAAAEEDASSAAAAAAEEEEPDVSSISMTQECDGTAKEAPASSAGKASATPSSQAQPQQQQQGGQSTGGSTRTRPSSAKPPPKTSQDASAKLSESLARVISAKVGTEKALKARPKTKSEIVREHKQQSSAGATSTVRQKLMQDVQEGSALDDGLGDVD